MELVTTLDCLDSAKEAIQRAEGALGVANPDGAYEDIYAAVADLRRAQHLLVLRIRANAKED